MALTNCKECKKEVSTSAKVCPHCGVKDPGVTLALKVGSTIFFIVVIWIIVAVMFGGDDKQKADTVAVKTAPAKTPEQIAAELAACKADIQCWGDKYNVEADIQCDEYIERLANYSFEWTDGWMDPKLSHFRWLDQDKGWITYIGDKIKFQNGFGVWQNIIYECDFAPETNTVMNVRAEPGML